MEVFSGFAVGAEVADGFGDVFIVDGEHASFAGAEVFGGVEGVGAGVAVGTDAFVVVFGEVCLCGVVDDF